MHSDKYGRTYHLPFSLGAMNDDRIQFDWQALLDAPVVLTEKLDGENNCIKSDGVYARSHAAPTRNAWAANVWQIWERVNHDIGDWHLFGENLYGVHSIEYTDLYAHFFLFAVRDGDRWLSWQEVEDIAFWLDLPTVPVRAKGTFSESELRALISEGMQAGSQLGGDCEGFVLRNIDGFGVDDFNKNVLKYVRQNHVQTDEHWTRNWRRAALRHERLVG